MSTFERVGRDVLPYISVNTEQNRILFNNKVLKDLNIKDRSGFMFYFDRENKRAKFELEDEHDSFRLIGRANRVGSKQIHSKHLTTYFVKTFDLPKKGTYRFLIKDKELFLFTI